MIGRLEHVKSPLFEGWATAAAEAHLALAPNATPATTDKRGRLTEKFADLAAASPPAAVVTAWIEVEKLLNGKIVAAGYPTD
jgi:hypothetical protein